MSKPKEKDCTKKDFESIGKLEIIYTDEKVSWGLSLNNFKESNFDTLCKTAEAMKRGRR